MRSGAGAALALRSLGAGGSCRLSEHVLEPVGHVAQRSIRRLQCLHARRRDFVVPLALAAALRRRVADARLDEALLFRRSSVVWTALTDTPRPPRFSISLHTAAP